MKVVVLKHRPKVDKRTLRIRTKRVRDAEGNMTSIAMLDANDPNFGWQLEAVFRRNVAKAIKENKKASKLNRHI
jgi:hypothetical protein